MDFFSSFGPVSAEKFNFILQIGCITVLALAGLLLVRFARKGLNTWTGISLVIGVICYLILETGFVHQSRPLFLIVVTISTSIPVIFFLLTKAIFDDDFIPSWQIPIWFALVIASHFWIYLEPFGTSGSQSFQIFYLISEVVSIAFVLAALYTAIKTRRNDLVESRLKFRSIFVAVTATLIGITLIVEAMPIARQSTDILQILQRSSILLLTVFFLLSAFEIRAGFFFREIPKEKPAIVVDTQLRKKLEDLIEKKKVYRTEGLTIGQLADMLGEQEYRLRRLINGELGFRNFNDFLNTYRVKEACEILLDESQNRKTILEIAYSLGYQSIGPFNKAFRDIKQTTPTSFRKSAKP